ncbi:retrovirus-related pol polyprotein from transposon TNT 1-94 [Tanacetum coccineum]
MTTLADKSLLSGGDNKQPMIEKHLYDSWKSRMELYMMNRPHGRMILASVEKAETIQADCDIKAINIILQGIPPEIYALVSQHRESLHEYYLRFTLLINDMNIYKIPLEQFQVNTKFLNTLPVEWSKFVTGVKLLKDLHTTNVDQIHAYLKQHERHANEVRLMHERNSNPLALYGAPLESQQDSVNQSSTPLSITYPSNNYQSSVHHNVYSPSSSIPQLEYAPSVNQQPKFSQPDSGLIVLVFQRGDDPIEKYCISLEVDSQTNQEIFQRDNSVSNKNAPSFDQLFNLNELKAQFQEKDTVIKKLKERIKSLSGKMNEDKIKKDLEEIETINIELDHRVSKLIAKNEHLKQTYKQLYDSIKPARIRSKEQCDDLINQVNLKSVEISNLNASLREKVLVITTLKDDLRKLKGKYLVDNDVTKHPSDPEMLKIDMELITPKLLNKKTAHSAYIKHTQEEAIILRDLVEHVKSKYPLDQSLESACRYAKRIQELLTNISKTCPSINNADGKLVAVTPKNKDKRVRFTEPVTSLGNTNTKTSSSSNLVSNKPMLSSIRVKPSTSASGSQPSGNTRKDKIQRTPSSTQKNKVEAHLRKVKSSLKNKDFVVEPKGTARVQHSKLNANSELKCVKCNGCMLSDNHDLCVLDFINNVNARTKSKSRPTGRTFTIVGNVCPLTRITTTNEVPLRKPTTLDNETSKPVVTLVYSRKPRKSKTSVLVSKSKVVQIVLWYLDSGCSKHMTGDRSQLTNFVNKFSGTVKFGNNHVKKILGYGDYQIGNVTISRVYYVEGLGHNLFSIGQFCDSNLEVAFRQHTCFIRNLEGVDLLTGYRGNNLYTLSLRDIMVSSPICLLSKASKTKSWLWHRRLSHLNFSAINHLARHGLVRGLPKLKFEKDHMCSACAMGKSKKKPHKPKSEDTNQEKLYLLHMDLCGPMCVASVNGKKYILVIVDDYSRFTWVECLRSKDEALNFIIKFLKMIQVRLKVPVRRIRTDNGTEFVNQTLREYYEKVGISHETSVARSLQ